MPAASNARATVINPFDGPKDSGLDPPCPFFDAEEWAKAYMSIIHNDADRYPQRTTGVSYRDINVYGYGSETTTRKTSSVFSSMHSIRLGRFSETERESQFLPVLRVS
jgi:hypothetical protein